MSDERLDNLKEILLAISEADADERTRIVARVQEEHPELAGEVGGLLPFVDASDEHFLGPEEAGRAPSQIGRFSVERLIGRGSMGEVYLAAEPAPLKRPVAVKLIRGGLASRQLRRRFEFEREVLTSLDHDNIAKVLDGGTAEEGALYIAMEYIDGPPLTRYAAERRLAIEPRIGLVRQVCAGVAHAHLKGLVHRDLKPANVLVCERDGQPVAKIIDFGIAKLIGHEASTMDTLPGTPLGTIEYMSPEQAQGLLARVDQRSDVYSIGVMLYELLTGQLPRSRQSILEWVGPSFAERMAASRLRPPSEILSAEASAGFSGTRRRELDWIVLRAVAVDPEARYRSAIELADDLGRFLDGSPVRAAPPSGLYRLRKAVRRRPFTAALAVVSTLGFVGFTVSLGVSQRATQRALEQARRSDQEKGVALGEVQRERDAAVRARDETKRAVGFLTSILSGSSPMQQPQSATVAQVIDEANRRLDAEIPQSDAARLELRKSLFQVLVYRGDFAGAIGQAQKLIVEATEIHGADHFETGHAHVGLATALMFAEETELAKASFRLGIAVLQALGTAEANRVAAFAQMRLAAVAANEGDISAAIELCTPLVEVFDSQVPRHSNRLSVRWLLSHMLRVYGRTDEAVRYAREALALVEQRAVETRPTDHANARHYLALARLASERDPSALANLNAAVTELTTWYGVDHRESIVLRISLCDAAADAGDASATRIDDALALLDVAATKLAGEPNLLASARLSVGRLLMVVRRDVEAIGIMTPALATDNKLSTSDALIEASLRLELATALARLQRADEATSVLQGTPARLVRILPEDHPLVVRANQLAASLEASL